MSRLEIPIAGKILWSTGDVLLRTDLELLVKDNRGNWRRQTFLVDTGSEMTTMPAYEAKQLDLPLPQKASPGAVHAQTGLEIRSGILRFQIVGMDPTEYSIPCLFLGDPSKPHTGPPASRPRRLLQPLALVDRLRFICDHSPGSGTPHGELIVERK